MKNKYVIISFFILLLEMAGSESILAQKIERVVMPPKKIEYEDTIYSYSPAWKDEEIYIEANLDDEPTPEIIIGFVSTFKPPPREDKKDKKSFVPEEKQEIIPIEVRVFYQIYKKELDGKYHLNKTFSGMDRLGHIQVFSLSKTSGNALAILNPGGEHYTDLAIYRWQEGGYRLIFNEGSRDGITIDTTKDPVNISLEKSGQKDKAQNQNTKMFVWKPEKNIFKLIE